MSSEILVIIVTYNGMQWIQKCIFSVLDSQQGADIFIVDNGSTDGTREFLRELASSRGNVLLKESGENLGFAVANNAGLSYALDHDYKYIYLLNQDAWIFRDTFRKLTDALKDNPRFGLLSPVQMQADLIHQDRNFRKHCGAALKLASKSPVKVRFVMAAHWMISREALEKTGLFSPRFPHYGEDENWIDRLHCKGLLCGVVPGASAVHDRGWRKTPKEERIRHKFIGCRVRVCNPAAPFHLCCCIQILKLIGIGIRNFSLLPFRFIPEFIREAPQNKAVHDS